MRGKLRLLFVFDGMALLKRILILNKQLDKGEADFFLPRTYMLFLNAPLIVGIRTARAL